MLKSIPAEIEPFNSYINKTDDCQCAIIEHYVFPLKEDGTHDFSNYDKEKVKGPTWETWDWTEEESRQWSLFRKKNDELYSEYTSAEGEKRIHLQQQLESNISACISFDKEHKIMERFVHNDNMYLEHLQVFGIQTDYLKIETPLRTISILYEKQIPFTKLEKEFFKKYKELHEQVPIRVQQICDEIKELKASIPGLWEKIYVTKEKIDKATNKICIPPPEMEGSFSPWMYAYMPTEEEQQVLVDDCNAYANQFIKEVNKLCEGYDRIFDELYEEDEAIGKKINPLFYKVNEMEDELIQNYHNLSLHNSILDQDYQDFMEVRGKEYEKAEAAWDDFNSKENVFIEVYNALWEVVNPESPKEKATIDVNPPANNGYEPDDLRAETMQRYESGTIPYFDIDDWHIILDHYEHKWDEKNQAIALEKAMTQHPENATLLLRKAQEEIRKHEYQKALDFVKKAEAQGHPHHPNFYFIKADIFRQIHAQEDAIPLYMKIIDSKGAGLEPFQERARYNLIQVYAKMEKYEECIRLSKELFNTYPEDDQTAADLANYYRLSGKLKEAEEILNAFLKEFPESSACLVQLGHLYFDTKEYAKAVKQFKSSYELDPGENYDSLNQAGNAYMEMMRFDEAVVCYETGLFHYHLNKEYHLAAAKCYKELNMPYAVRYHIKKALEIDPDYFEAQQLLPQQGN